MADGYDRFENEGSGGGSFVMGLLTGTVLGAGLGMLFAPKAGSELRNQLTEQAGNLANQAQDGIRKVSENAGDWAERGRDMYGKAKDAVAKGADEAQKYVRDTAGSIGESGAAMAGAGAGQGSGSSGMGSSASGMGSGSGSSSGVGGSGSTGSGSGSGSSFGGSSESMRA